MTTTTTEEVSIGAEIGATIRDLMFRKGVSQAEIAAAIGVDKSGVSHKIHGRVRWSITDLYKAARVLGVDPGDLLPRLDSNQQPFDYQSIGAEGVNPRLAVDRTLQAAWVLAR